jgi:pentatricopeptide repeat protein
MISGYAQQGYGEQAFYLFGLMNKRVWSSGVLHTIGSPGTTLKQGTKVHSRIIEAELESNIHLVTALIRMYTKYGSLADGHWVFDRMLTQD